MHGAIEAGLTPTVVTFDPHPREVLGNHVELLSTLERRLELLAEAGVEETLVVEFTPEVRRTRAGGVRAVVPARDRRGAGGRGRGLPLRPRRAAATSRCSSGSACDARSRRSSRASPRRGSASSSLPATSAARRRCSAARPRSRARSSRARPRGGTLGFPTANLRTDPTLLVPGYGIYAGAARDHRAAVSIGVNPHYGGAERKIEVFLLDFDGDLYGERLVVELWERLRDEAAFASESELVAQIARDVDATRAATRPPA